MALIGDAFLGGYRAREAGNAQKAALAEREQRMAWERDDRARKQTQLTAEDDAWRSLGDLEKNGVADGSKLGLSGPSTQMLVAGNTGYGVGDAAAKEAAGDFQREAGRFAAAGIPAQGGPRFDATADVQRTAAKESDIYGGMMGVARARKDMGAYATTRGLQKGAKEDELIAGVKLPAADSPEFAAMADQLASYVNTNHQQLTLGEPDTKGFRDVSIVKPNGKSVFIRLSRAEQLKMMQANALLDTNPTRAMKMFEDINKDIANVVARDSDLVSKVGEAGNMTAYRRVGLEGQAEGRADQRAFQQESLANDAARVGIARTAAKNAESRAAAGDWRPETYTDEKGNVVVYDANRRNPNAPQVVRRPDMPGLKPYNPRPQQETRVGAHGEIIRADGSVFVPDEASPSGYRQVNLGPSALDLAIEARLKAGGSGQPTANVPGARPAARAPAPALQTTKSPDGKTMYRYEGQPQWYPNKVDALSRLGAPNRAEPQGSYGQYYFGEQ